MNTPAIKKMEIINSLAYVPDSHLDQIKEYIDRVVAGVNSSRPGRRSLKGIWKDKGFEKIIDLDGELKAVRKELERSIFERKL